MDKLKGFVAAHWKPALILLAGAAAGYFVGPKAKEAVEAAIRALFGM